LKENHHAKTSAAPVYCSEVVNYVQYNVILEKNVKVSLKSAEENDKKLSYRLETGRQQCISL